MANTEQTIVSHRRARILEFLRKNGSGSVELLSSNFGVSPVTIRRDLDALNKKGYVLRTHGGASLLDISYEKNPEYSFFEKEITHIQEKRRIAEAATNLIPDDAILFINSGTTVLFFLAALQKAHMRVITNNLPAVHEITRNKNIELFLLGGEYRSQSCSLVGDMAVSSLQDIYSDYTVLGINGISLEQGLMTSVFAECSINRTMINNTRGKVIVLADHSKLGNESNFTTAELSCVDIIVTDNQSSPAIVSALREKGIEVIIA